jgi:glutaredoxin-like protein NrdH
LFIRGKHNIIVFSLPFWGRGKIIFGKEVSIMNMNHVEGRSGRRLTLYTLSTCIWCKKTKELLQELNVGYDHVEVDLLDQAEKDRVMEEIKKFNPRCSFPSLVIDGSECIVGFDEQKIKEAVGA